ncbi:MAG TPA: tetratricopeptide repeat protein [Myxococcota bacterium]|nr:tetratricopeptide repeat protein [Myxococcota bacterium]HQK50440.1 tetratricopeptide repeat protein [Myxococcota bacterium]
MRHHLPAAVFLLTLPPLLLLPERALPEETEETTDLVSEVIRDCPRNRDPGGYQELEARTLDRVRLAISTGRIREAHAATEALIACHARQQQSRRGQEFSERLRRTFCRVTLRLVEQERNASPEQVRRARELCPVPSESPPDGENAIRRWGEDARRHLLFLSLVEDSSRTFREARDSARALRKTGLWTGLLDEQGPPTSERSGVVLTDTLSLEGDDSEDFSWDRAPGTTPNPLVTAETLLLASGMATNRLEEVFSLMGGQEALCRSTLLQDEHFLSRFPIEDRSALRLAVNHVLASGIPDPLAALLDQAQQRLPEEECPFNRFVAWLVASSLKGPDVDLLVSHQQAHVVARFFREIPALVKVPGSEASRQAILGYLLEPPPFEGQEDRRCELARSLLKTGSYQAALNLWAARSSEQAPCSLGLRIEAGLLLEMERGVEQEGLTSALTDLLSGSPASEDIQEVLSQPRPVEAQVLLVRRLGDLAVRKERDAPARHAVLRSLALLAQAQVGTPVAGKAIEFAMLGGWEEDPEEMPLLLQVACRHHLLVHQPEQSREAWRGSLAALQPGMEKARDAFWMLTVWLVEQGYESWIRRDRSEWSRVLPSSPPIASQVALAMARRGLGDLAVQVLRHATMEMRTKRPLDASSRMVLADAWITLGRPDIAGTLLSSRGGPVGVEVISPTLLARKALAEHRYDAAIDLLTDLLSRQPKDPDGLYLRAMVWLVSGRPEQAEKDLLVCLESGQPSAALLGGIGFARFDQGRPAEAEESFRRALELKADSPDNQVGLVLSVFRQGRLEEARGIWEQTLRTHPLFRKGLDDAERAGYLYSPVEKKAWRDFHKALRSR